MIKDLKLCQIYSKLDYYNYKRYKKQFYQIFHLSDTLIHTYINISIYQFSYSSVSYHIHCPVRITSSPSKISKSSDSICCNTAFSYSLLAKKGWFEAFFCCYSSKVKYFLQISDKATLLSCLNSEMSL